GQGRLRRPQRKDPAVSQGGAGGAGGARRRQRAGRSGGEGLAACTQLREQLDELQAGFERAAVRIDGRVVGGEAGRADRYRGRDGTDRVLHLPRGQPVWRSELVGRGERGIVHVEIPVHVDA